VDRRTARWTLGYLVVALALTWPNIGAAAKTVSGGAGGPSFRCDSALNPAEQLVCGDPELSAYDRALAAQYSSKPASAARRRAQRAWLAERDGCGARRDCIIDAYRRGLSLTNLLAKAETLSRKVAPPDGADLLLQYQSPTRTITPVSDDAVLRIRSLGRGLYAFEVSALYVYDPHDGRGVNASDGGTEGFVYLRNEEGHFGGNADIPGECAVDFTRLPDGAWKLVDTAACGGVGATLTGIYGPDRRRAGTYR
jgi:uncharacterized protein